MAEKQDQIALFIEQLSDLNPHKVADIASALTTSKDSVKRLRKHAEKQGFKIIWSNEGYLLVPSSGMLTDSMMIVRTMNWVKLIENIQEAYQRKYLETQEIKKLIDPALLSTIYRENVVEHVPYVPGKMVEMQSLLSVVHRTLLKNMDYKAFLRTRYWSIVRAEVMHRDDGVCQFCNDATGTDAHHTTYEHHGWEDEYLSDLVLLCRACHESAEEAKEV